MANKAISELPQASNVNNQDLFVLEQSGIAKKLTAETFITEQGIIDALAEALDGHGGIQSVTLSSVSGRIRTYLITFTDGSATTFQVLDGTSITSIQKTSTAGLVDTYTVYMSDGTTSFFQVRNGQDGSATWDQINSKAPIITDTASGTIANFPDGADDIPVVDLVANIEPKQDLTYGDPYPAGGGANILPPLPVREITRNGITFKSDGNGTYSLSGTASSSASFKVNLDEPITYAAGTYYMSALNNTFSGLVGFYGVSALTNKWDIVINANNKTQQITFEADTTIDALSVYIGNGSTVNYKFSPVLSKTGFVQAFTPYSNICPITGHTGVNVTRTGKNLIDDSVKMYFMGNVHFAKSQTGTTAVLPSGTYTFSVVTADGTVSNLYAENTDTNADIGTAYNATTLSFTLTETTPIHLWAYKKGYTTASDITSAQLELGSTATAYEPYQSNTVTVDWTSEAGTIYGGTIDVATGLLTVNRAMVDLGAQDNVWYKVTGNNYANFFSNYILNWAKYNANVPTCICSNYKSVANNTASATEDNYVWLNPQKVIRLKDTSKANMTVEEFKAAMSGVQLVYELATPQTYQLTPQEVLHTLYGVNNVWADTGNVSVTYPADTKMFIEKLTMPTEDDLVANQAITSGQYFMVGNSLYLALANIASGAQITIGTNAQRVSLADALNTINS